MVVILPLMLGTVLDGYAINHNEQVYTPSAYSIYSIVCRVEYVLYVLQSFLQDV
jgi:hypothetical protein